MAEITLSEYGEEAKELIRSDAYDQAIAICRQILEHFPKHVTSYRLLGEACLERGDYVEAANLLKRVLSVDPEDVIAYVGLAIIYDEQGALEEAIWQLERAFELTPGNAEIRGELQRLYGERDGTAPPRLKLTPAALGRLYLKEELYERAIDEFRGVLEEDPERVDIQVALAEALWWNDQRREAAEVCDGILEKLPNCLKANLILGGILLNSDRGDEGRTLLRAAQAMDPENTKAQELFRDQSPLPFEPVYVRRLEKAEIEGEAREISAEATAREGEPEPGEERLPSPAEAELEAEMPDWLRKLREDEKRPTEEQEEAVAPPRAEAMPDWLRELEEGMPEEARGPVPPPEEKHLPFEEETPTWLRKLPAVSEALGVEEVPAPVQDEAEEVAPLEAAGKEEIPTVEGEEVELGEEDVARLRETMPDEPASIEEIMARMETSKAIIAEEEAPEGLVEEGAPTTEEAPDWLRELRAKTVEEEAVAPTEARVEETVTPPEAVVEEKPLEKKEPSWEELEPEPPMIAGLEEEFPMVGEGEVEISEEAIARLRETMPDESASVEEIMDWMERSKSIIAEEEAVEEDVAAPVREAEALPEEVAAPSAEEEIPAWLRELRAEAVEEEVAGLAEGVEASLEEVAAPSAEEEIPAWLRELRAEAVEEEIVAPLEIVEALPEEVAALRPEDEIPSWLRELQPGAVEEEALVEEVEALPEEVVALAAEEEIPSWLRELRAEVIEEEVAAPLEEVSVLPAEEEIPSWMRDLRAEAMEEEFETPPEEVVPPTEEEIPAWMRDLRAEAMEEEFETPPEEVVPPTEEEIPAWMRDLRAEAMEEEVETPPEEAAPPTEEEIPAWMRDLRAEAMEEEVAPPMAEVEAAPGEAAIPLEEEVEPILAEEAIPPSFVEEPPLIEIVPVEKEEVIEAAPAAEKVEEEPAKVAWSIENLLSHLASNPRDHEARLALARACLRERDLDQAAFHYREIVSSGGLLDEAIDDLEATADDAPDHVATHELLADAYVKDGRLQKALDKYRWLRAKLAG
jgi:tetratricopeptide (TPR) repeat protein